MFFGWDDPFILSKDYCVSNIVVYEDREEVGNITISNYDFKFRRLYLTLLILNLEILTIFGVLLRKYHSFNKKANVCFVVEIS